MSHLLIVKRLELYMDLALYKINILLLLVLLSCSVGFVQLAIGRLSDCISRCRPLLSMVLYGIY